MYEGNQLGLNGKILMVNDMQSGYSGNITTYHSEVDGNMTTYQLI